MTELNVGRWFLRQRVMVHSSSSSSSLFQSQRSLKSQLNRKQSMLTIIRSCEINERARDQMSQRNKKYCKYNFNHASIKRG